MYITTYRVYVTMEYVRTFIYLIEAIDVGTLRSGHGQLQGRAQPETIPEHVLGTYVVGCMHAQQSVDGNSPRREGKNKLSMLTRHRPVKVADLKKERRNS